MEPVIQASFTSNYSNTFKLLWPYVMSVFMTVFITMSIVPGIATLAVSSEASITLPLTSRFFLPVACFLVFSIGDICGRLSSGWLALVIGGRISIFVVTCARLLFIPLLMLCNLHPRRRLPVVFLNDAYYIVFMALFGLTNGFCFSEAMLLGTRRAPSRWKNEISVLLSLAVGVGLIAGSFASVGLLQLL